MQNKPAAQACSPTPDEIRAARAAAGLTQVAAAELVHSTERAWQTWEGGERKMSAAVFELFGIKTAKHRRAERKKSTA
jgi:putative transcriptional regulator